MRRARAKCRLAARSRAQRRAVRSGCGVPTIRRRAKVCREAHGAPSSTLGPRRVDECLGELSHRARDPERTSTARDRREVARCEVRHALERGADQVTAARVPFTHEIGEVLLEQADRLLDAQGAKLDVEREATRCGFVEIADEVGRARDDAREVLESSLTCVTSHDWNALLRSRMNESASSKSSTAPSRSASRNALAIACSVSPT